MAIHKTAMYLEMSRGRRKMRRWILMNLVVAVELLEVGVSIFLRSTWSLINTLKACVKHLLSAFSSSLTLQHPVKHGIHQDIISHRNLPALPVVTIRTLIPEMSQTFLYTLPTTSLGHQCP